MGTFVAAVDYHVVDGVVVAGNCLSVGPSVPWCCTSAVASPRAGSWSYLHTLDVAGAAAAAVCVCVCACVCGWGGMNERQVHGARKSIYAHYYEMIKDRGTIPHQSIICNCVPHLLVVRVHNRLVRALERSGDTGTHRSTRVILLVRINCMTGISAVLDPSPDIPHDNMEG